MPDLTEFSGPVIVTAAYFLLWYYLLLIVQRGTKYRLKDRYARNNSEFDRYFGQDPEMLAADRAVINTQEQMLPFLFGLWLHAVFASVGTATMAGAAYIILRAFYPILLGKQVSKIQSKRVYLVTLPCYLIVFYLLGGAVWGVLH